mmetsp:Transcript_2666/g.6437  ORF Transcript_2666/g.6437 Transcript_2666/m.6437 type:complete len:240 (-) Transcript_2666:380-1099(-)
MADWEHGHEEEAEGDGMRREPTSFHGRRPHGGRLLWLRLQRLLPRLRLWLLRRVGCVRRSHRRRQLLRLLRLHVRRRQHQRGAPTGAGGRGVGGSGGLLRFDGGSGEEAAAGTAHAAECVPMARLVQVGATRTDALVLVLGLRARRPALEDAVVLLGVHVDRLVLHRSRARLCRQLDQPGRLLLRLYEARVRNQRSRGGVHAESVRRDALPEHCGILVEQEALRGVGEQRLRLRIEVAL